MWFEAEERKEAGEEPAARGRSVTGITVVSAVSTTVSSGQHALDSASRRLGGSVFLRDIVEIVDHRLGIFTVLALLDSSQRRVLTLTRWTVRAVWIVWTMWSVRPMRAVRQMRHGGDIGDDISSFSSQNQALSHIVAPVDSTTCGVDPGRVGHDVLKVDIPISLDDEIGKVVSPSS